MKSCKVCAAEFVPTVSTMQAVCSPKCAAKVPKMARKAATVERQQHAKALVAIKPRAKLIAEAQVAFNAWVRARDAHRGCISCGTTKGKVNAGHYLSVGARPELRFEPDNVHRQCERCNTYLHGNLIDYRVALWWRIGMNRVAWLEGPHEPRKWSRDDLLAIKADYAQRTRALKAAQ